MSGTWGLSYPRSALVLADPTRLAAQVVSGLGFVEAGAMLRDSVGVRGLTTASTIWVSGSLGVVSAVENVALVVCRDESRGRHPEQPPSTSVDAPSADVTEIARLATSIDRWRVELRAYFRTGRSSAAPVAASNGESEQIDAPIADSGTRKP